MAREFKPLRFFVLMAIAAFVVCGVTAFYTHRGSWQNRGGTGGLVHRRESRRTSAARHKIANGR